MVAERLVQDEKQGSEQMMAGESGQPDVSIPNVATVGDAQAVFYRQQDKIDRQQDKIEMMERMLGNCEQQITRLLAQPMDQQRRIELVDVKTMSPEKFKGERSENFKTWAKKVKAYTNAKTSGYRQALESAEKMAKDAPVTASVMASWNWADAEEASLKFYEMLLLITEGEAQVIVESAAGQGFEAWRLLSVRYDSAGELYTFDKVNAMMRQTQAKHISDMPASIAKFEKDIKTFETRTGKEFPEMMKLPILIQMIPASWKKEFETHWRSPGVDKD